MREDYYRLTLVDIQEINRLRLKGQVYTEELEKIEKNKYRKDMKK